MLCCLGFLFFLGCGVRVFVLLLVLFIQFLACCILHGILVFGVFIHVAFEEALQRSQDSFEGRTSDVEASGLSHSIDACLSGLPTQQSDLAKIFAFALEMTKSNVGL